MNNSNMVDSTRTYTLRNGVSVPWISYGTGVVWKYSRSPIRFTKVVAWETLSSIKHHSINRELYRNIHVKKILLDAYLSGFRSYDTGRIYGKSEKKIGKVLDNKDDVFIVSKCSVMDIERKNSPNNVAGNLEITLKNIRRHTLDLYLLHWPEGEHWLDYYKEIVSLYCEGKVKAFGICNVTLEHLMEIEKQGIELPMVVQEECHPFNSRRDVREFCLKHNILFEAHTATARSCELVHKCKVLQNIAKKYNKNATQVIIRWHFQNGVIPVINTSSRNHMKENMDIFDFSLSDEEMAAIDSLDNKVFFIESKGIDDPYYVYND